MVNFSFSLSLTGLGGTGLALVCPVQSCASLAPDWDMAWRRRELGRSRCWHACSLDLGDLWNNFSLVRCMCAHTHTHTHTDPHTDPHTDQKGFSHYSSVSTGLVSCMVLSLGTQQFTPCWGHLPYLGGPELLAFSCEDTQEPFVLGAHGSHLLLFSC